MFPNTINDYEITAFEPFVQYLPRASKGVLAKMFTAMCMIVVFGLGMVMVAVKRSLLIVTGQRSGRWEHLLPLLMTLLLCAIRLIVVMNWSGVSGAQGVCQQVTTILIFGMRVTWGVDQQSTLQCPWLLLVLDSTNYIIFSPLWTIHDCHSSMTC
eukprot:gene21755-27811_t